VSATAQSVRGRGSGWISAGLCVLLGLAFLILPLGRGLERLSYDLPFAVRADVLVNEVVLVSLDDISHAKLNQPYRAAWDRKLHADLLRRLTRLAARAIVFDIAFTESSADTAADAQFVQSAKEHGLVILAAEVGTGRYYGGTEIVLRLPKSLLPNPDHWGITQFAETSDNTIREHDYGLHEMPSLAWRTATLLKLSVTEPPGSERHRRWLNYYGPGGSLKKISYSSFLEETETRLAELIRGRVVFVGSGAQAGFSGDRKDHFSNPYTRFGEPSSAGVEIHATMLANLMREDWLRRPSPWLELAGVVFSGLGLGLGLTRLRPLVAAGTSLIVGLIFFGVAVLLLSFWQIWFSWAVIALVQTPVALACVVLFAAQARATTPLAEVTREFPRSPSTLAIPDHELLHCVGVGGYGEVWLARAVTGVFRAVKFVRGQPGDRRFQREFEGLKKFEPISRAHAGLVDVLHAGRNDAGGYFYYVMELADDSSPDSGVRNAESDAPSPSRVPHSYHPRTLDGEVHRREHWTLDECVRCGIALADALDFLHGQGLVHRDIKPSNIVFIGGAPKLADIGLVTDAGEARTRMGTEGYLAPEGMGTVQADIFSLGRVLYAIATGLDWRRFPEWPSLDVTPADSRRWLRLHETICQACEQDPRRRYASAREMKDKLQMLN